MKNVLSATLLSLLYIVVYGQEGSTIAQSPIEINKRIARDFYQDLWFTNNTDNYVKYVGSTYVVHDIGDRKGVTEPAIEQKNIAGFFWKHAELEGKIDYQIAEGDLVATRWTASMKKTKTLFGSFALDPGEPFSIINVFRINDGKIVEFWNHRHDIDTPQTLKFVFRGLIIGLLIALIPTVIAFRLRKKLRTAHGRPDDCT